MKHIPTFESFINEAVNPEMDKKVKKFIKGIADLHDYSEEDAVRATVEALKRLGYGNLLESNMQSGSVNESIVDKIKSLFKKTPAETKLLNSLDLFSNEADLLGPGPEKIEYVINKAKQFGLELDDTQALEILQKKLATYIEELEKDI